MPLRTTVLDLDMAKKKAEPEVEPVIVSAAGASSQSSTGGQNLGKMMEEAMSNEILKIGKETEEISADPNKTDEQKQAEIAELTNPSNQKVRMMEARQAIKDQFNAEAQSES